MIRLAIPIIVFAALLCAWEALARLGLINVFFLPPPLTLATTLIELIEEGFPEGISLGSHVVSTLRRCLLGYLMAVAVAVPLGIVIGYFRTLEVLTRNFIVFGRSVAPISVLPLFIAWFGIGEVSKVAVIMFASFWAAITNTVAGVRFVDPELIRAARSLGASPLGTFYAVILPAALPRIFTGLKVSLAIAFMVIVAAEMIATVYGLGALIYEARTWFRTDITMVGMLVIGVLGLLASMVLDGVERWLMPWSAARRRE